VLRNPRIPLLGALACLTLLAITGLMAYFSPVAHVRDAAALQGFTALNRPRLTPWLNDVAHLANPLPYALIGLGLAGIAAARGRGRVAVAILVLLVVNGATTEALKQLLAHPRHADWLAGNQISAASWPSGHATASMTLALSFVLAVPARLRPLAAAVGTVFAISVSYAILALAWHWPSDVVGGFLVATTWTLVAVAAVAKLDLVRPPAGRVADAGAAPLWSTARIDLALAAGAAVLGLGVAIARPRAVAEFALERPSFVIVAGVIATLAAVLAATMARAARP
jgi:membrane-associated phospholipid phosphatase